MATSAIPTHYAHLQRRGVDLGAPHGDEQDAGYGGRYQAYERGRIYWTPTTGAHEVHGPLLQKYLDGGASDVTRPPGNASSASPPPAAPAPKTASMGACPSSGE